MADYNSVPLGQAGTGAAFVLGQSQAAKNLLDTIENNQQVPYKQHLYNLKRAKEIADDWNKNQLKVDGGLYWQPEFDKRYQDDLDSGIKLRQSGLNPYNYDVNDPKQVQAAQEYLLNRQGIISDIDTRKAKESAVADQFKLLKADPSAFRAKSIEALNNYTKLPFAEAKKMEVPVLEKAFDREGEFFKLADPVTNTDERIVKKPNGYFTVKGKVMDTDATRKIGETILNNSLRGKNFIEDETGLPIDQVKSIPSGFDANIKDLTDAYNGDPNIKADFASKYGVTNLDQAKPIINKMAQERAIAKKKYDNILDGYVQRANAKVDPTKSEMPFFGYDEQERQRAAARRAAAKEEKVVPPITIGNIDGYVPTIKQDGTIVNEKSANIFTQNFNNEKVTIKPSKIFNPKTGHAEVNTEPFDINVGSVSMVPVFKGLGNDDPRNDSEMSYRILEETLSGKHPNFKSSNITFKPFVYGTRSVDGEPKGISVPYDAVKGNEHIKTENFDKTVKQFQDAVNSNEFKSLSAKERLEWLKQNFKLK